MDLGTNSLGWAIVSTDNDILDQGSSRVARRAMARQVRRQNFRSLHRFSKPGFTNKIRIVFPVFLHCLLALLFAGSLLMAIANKKDFQFWFNLAITILLGWIALKK